MKNVYITEIKLNMINVAEFVNADVDQQDFIGLQHFLLSCSL